MFLISVRCLFFFFGIWRIRVCGCGGGGFRGFCFVGRGDGRFICEN